jgi:hypothetical protein
MKTLLFLAAMMFCMTRSEATDQVSGPLYLNGDLTWNITEPQCGFKLKGKMRNISAVATGPVRLVLWASKFPYPPTVPNPSNAVIAGEFPLGALASGYQFDNFTVKTPSQMPIVNGVYHFTIAVVENVGGTYYNRFLISGGAYEFVNGVWKNQVKWSIPAKPVLPPPAAIDSDAIIYLDEKATGEFNKFPSGWRTETKLAAVNLHKLTFKTDNLKATVSYSYSVVKTNLRGDNEWTGKLVMTYGENNNVTFKDTVYLYFTSPTSGTYKSVAKGFLFEGDIGDSTTWGLFELN